MTLEDLLKVYDKAANDVAFLQYEGPDKRAGIAAVVRALGPMFSEAYIMALEDQREGGPRRYDRVQMIINSILGSDAEGAAEYTGGMSDLCVTPAAPIARK